MDGMLIGKGIAGECTVGVSDGVTEEMFDTIMIDDGPAEGCAVSSSDDDGVTV